MMEYQLWRVLVVVPGGAARGPEVMGGGQRLPVEQEAGMGED
jgi:hypothetical protein